MSGFIAFLTILICVIYYAIDSLFFKENREKQEREKNERELAEKEQKRKYEFEVAKAKISKLRELLDAELAIVNAESNKRREKRAEKLYFNPVHGLSKYMHNGSRYVIFDLETTGLNAGRSQITEIAAVRYIDDEPVEQFETLVKIKKGTRIGAKAMELTGITVELLNKEGIEIDAAIKQFMQFIGNDKIMSYNIEFDVGFIEAAIGQKLQNKQKCIYKMARQKWRERYSYKLVDLISSECWRDVEESHRAMRDVELAHELLMKIAYD